VAQPRVLGGRWVRSEGMEGEEWLTARRTGRRGGSHEDQRKRNDSAGREMLTR
jgi:hypothetical protein